MDGQLEGGCLALIALPIGIGLTFGVAAPYAANYDLGPGPEGVNYSQDDFDKAELEAYRLGDEFEMSLEDGRTLKVSFGSSCLEAIRMTGDIAVQAALDSVVASEACDLSPSQTVEAINEVRQSDSRIESLGELVTNANNNLETMHAEKAQFDSYEPDRAGAKGRAFAIVSGLALTCFAAIGAFKSQEV